MERISLHCLTEVDFRHPYQVSASPSTVWQQSSPRHVSPDLPPFLLLFSSSSDICSALPFAMEGDLGVVNGTPSLLSMLFCLCLDSASREFSSDGKKGKKSDLGTQCEKNQGNRGRASLLLSLNPLFLPFRLIIIFLPFASPSGLASQGVHFSSSKC